MPLFCQMFVLTHNAPVLSMASTVSAPYCMATDMVMQALSFGTACDSEHALLSNDIVVRFLGELTNLSIEDHYVCLVDISPNFTAMVTRHDKLAPLLFDMVLEDVCCYCICDRFGDDAEFQVVLLRVHRHII